MPVVEALAYSEEVEGESGRFIDGVRAVCTECGLEVEAFGQGQGSLDRCAILLREQCPDDNFYEVEWA